MILHHEELNKFLDKNHPFKVEFLITESGESFSKYRDQNRVAIFNVVDHLPNSVMIYLGLSKSRYNDKHFTAVCINITSSRIELRSLTSCDREDNVLNVSLKKIKSSSRNITPKWVRVAEPISASYRLGDTALKKHGDEPLATLCSI